ncbi:MAG TPA: DEAD/DEAH box helicase [Candidatus Nitrosocosmicus sp.]|nr:DEAD/DEAH box helicase [Candidatus Nitrosocosmicus sp.]
MISFNTKLKPLQHQIETIQKLDENFANNKYKNMVVLPSGSGKTHTIAFHVNKIKPGSFLYIVHRNEILYQTVKIFKEVCGEWLRSMDIGVINEKNKDFDKPFIFATIQTLSIQKNLEQMNPKIAYMVIDEYHHVAAKSYETILDYFKPKFFVGLTATPYRLDSKDIHSYVENTIANEIDLFEGIKKNILVPFHYVGLYDNINYSDIKWNGYSYDISDLDKKLIIVKRDEAVLKEYNEKIRLYNKPTIAFCNSINHVERMVSLFIQNGIKAIGITHKEKYKIRQEKIEGFKKGIYDIIFTRDILNEGVDFPECSAIMFLRPTISKTVFFQQLGRGLRKKEGKKDVLVLDYIGNYYKAFSRKSWLFEFSGISTNENIKPEYKYELPNGSTVWFDSRVINIFDIQERALKHRFEDQLSSLSHLDTNEQKQHIIDNYIIPLQKELGRQYIAQTDWRKKYGGFLQRPYFHGKGKWAEFKQWLGLPDKYIMHCVVCNKEFSSRVANRTKLANKYSPDMIVCSRKCNGKFFYEKHKRRILAEKGEIRGILHNKYGVDRFKLKECLFCKKPINQDLAHNTPRYFCDKACDVLYNQKGNQIKVKSRADVINKRRTELRIQHREARAAQLGIIIHRNCIICNTPIPLLDQRLHRKYCTRQCYAIGQKQR